MTASGLRRAHERVQAWVQAGYDVLWDRWGLYLGTARRWLWTGSWALLFAGASVHDALRSSDAMILAETLPINAFFVLVLDRLALRQHREAHALQAAGRYDVLNAVSRIAASLIPIYALVVVVIFWIMMPLLIQANPTDIVRNVLHGALLNLYAYLYGVMIRPRNEARFARFDGVPATGAL